MKRLRKGGLFDEESDNDDVVCINDDDDSGSNELSRTMRRVHLGSDEESGAERFDASLPVVQQNGDQIRKPLESKHTGTKKQSFQHIMSYSDDTSSEESSLPEENNAATKNCAAIKSAKKAFNILDDSSSSSSDDDSIDKFMNSARRQRLLHQKRQKKLRAALGSQKWYERDRKLALKPPPRRIQLSDGPMVVENVDTDSSAVIDHSIAGWSFIRSRLEYTIEESEKIPMFCLPYKLYEMLYDFQKDGVKWMVGLHVGKIGGILGDDMGMGKTIMTLSLLGGLMRSKTIRTALVIAPVSVLRNWENEARKILSLCADVRIQVIASDSSKIARERKLKQALESQSPQLVITTFGLITSSPDRFQHDRYNWDYVILDEAHRIKNPSAQVSQNIELIASNDETRRIILTGTPIMNNLKELHALFTFATSGKILGSHQDFQLQFGNPIEVARSADAINWEIEEGEKAMAELQELIRPYFLQRLKSDYLKEALPEKKEYVLWTNLSTMQRKIYTEYLQSKDSAVADYFRGLSNSPLFAITWLQKLCGHPLLVEHESADQIADIQEYAPETLLSQSAKLRVMYDLLFDLRGKGHRTLIFSQSTMVLDIIERVLSEKLHYTRIDGQTKEKDRQMIVDEFNHPESTVDALLISTKAGGQGLTLVGADTVIVYDPSWNPAEDAQAVGRCYRIGQKKKVTVYRLITSGSVEELRYEKQIHKDGLRRTILTSSGNQTAKYFTKEELRKKVFVLGEEGQCEFLHKLNQRGLNTLSGSCAGDIFTSHPGVVGQSSHDVVYSLPENWNDVEFIASTKASNPFCLPTSGGKWYEAKKNAILSKKPVSQTQRVLLPAEYSRQGVLNEENMDDLGVKGKSSFNEVLARAKHLHSSGHGAESMNLLMDISNGLYVDLSNDDKIALHRRLASGAQNLGWI